MSTVQPQVQVSRPLCEKELFFLLSLDEDVSDQVYKECVAENWKDVQVKWSWFDSKIVHDTLKLFNELSSRLSSSFTCGKLVLYVDTAEKKPLQRLLSKLKFAILRKCGAGDFWICINDKAYRVWERKTWKDLSGSIGGRSPEQKYKLQQILIEQRRRICYLIEESSLNSWCKPLSTLESAKVNIETRDGFGCVEKKSKLHTVMYLLKMVQKAEEFGSKFDAELARQPICTPETFNPLAMPKGMTYSPSIDEPIVQLASSNGPTITTTVDYMGPTKRSINEDDYLDAYGPRSKKTKDPSLDSVENQYTVFVRQLMVLRRLSKEQACAIAAVYPDWISLCQAAVHDSKALQKRIADLTIDMKKTKSPIDEQAQQSSKKQKSEVRRLGDALATRLVGYLRK